ncbi:hypothetical protein N9L92_01145, partial [Saprospiraceae bacterium]|nr:hypothetical protein [Saprospiraceae bacterium]
FAGSFWLYYSWYFFSISVNAWYAISIILPTVYIAFLIMRSKVKKDYSSISSACKILMFLGLIYIIVLAWI